jgi:hypothetical protein
MCLWCYWKDLRSRILSVVSHPTFARGFWPTAHPCCDSPFKSVRLSFLTSGLEIEPCPALFSMISEVTTTLVKVLNFGCTSLNLS